MPRVVLDTNVLVSALITPAGASARLLEELRAGSFELVLSPGLTRELEEVLRREKIRRYVTSGEAEAYVALLRRMAVIHEDPGSSGRRVAADPDDEYLIDLARVARADAIVSGDRHLLDLRDVLPILSPAEFLTSLSAR